MSVTSLPTVSTAPDASLPSAIGTSALYKAVRKYTSMKLTPENATLTTASLGPGDGFGSSTSFICSGPPGVSTTIRFMTSLQLTVRPRPALADMRARAMTPGAPHPSPRPLHAARGRSEDDIPGWLLQPRPHAFVAGDQPSAAARHQLA